MTEKQPARREKASNRIASIVLFVLAGLLVAAAIVGFILRGTEQSQSNLMAMRTRAVLHSASEGLVDKIAQEARADKLTELRKDKNFRKRGLNEVNEICDAAMEEARAEAEQKYSNPVVQDEEALRRAIDGLEDVLAVTDAKTDVEKTAYSDLYIQLMESVVSWRDIAPEGADDAAITAELVRLVPDMDKADNQHFQTGFVDMARAMAAKEQAQEDEKTANHAVSLVTGTISDWTVYDGLDDGAIWTKLQEDIPEISKYEAFRERLTDAAKQCAAAAANSEALPELVAEEDEGAVIASEALVDYAYIRYSDELNIALEQKGAAYDVLYAELVKIIPDLGGMSDKLQASLRDNIENVVRQGNEDFATTYRRKRLEHEAGLAGPAAAAGRYRGAAAGTGALLLDETDDILRCAADDHHPVLHLSVPAGGDLPDQRADDAGQRAGAYDDVRRAGAGNDAGHPVRHWPEHGHDHRLYCRSARYRAVAPAEYGRLRGPAVCLHVRRDHRAAAGLELFKASEPDEGKRNDDFHLCGILLRVPDVHRLDAATLQQSEDHLAAERPGAARDAQSAGQFCPPA